MQKFDAVVVGGGPGGYECAIRLSQNGKKTALVEEAELGGTCLNRGCIPTKTLLHSADVYYEAKNSAAMGVSTGDVTFDYAKIIERKNAVAKQLSSGIAFLEKNHGVTVFKNHAVFTDSHTVTLDDGEVLECDNLIIATGSNPARIPIPGVDLPGVVDSTGLLNMTTCPQHIIIVGGGVIGIEFATFYYRLGVKVTVIEMLDRVLGPLDKDITAFVEAELKKNGVELVLGVRVESIEEGLKVNYVSMKDGVKGVADYLRDYKATLKEPGRSDALLHYGESGAFEFDMQYDYVRLFLLDRIDYFNEIFSLGYIDFLIAASLPVPEA
jgi:dihydrolipoamide dehydrogenase